MRTWQTSAAVLAMMTVGFLTGCGPSVQPEDLGEIVYVVDSIPELRQTFPLPELAGMDIQRESSPQPGSPGHMSPR